MKKFFSVLAVSIVIMSCGNSGENSATTDSMGASTPTAIDTSTQHPNGMTNGSVISTDTASISLDNNGNVNGGDSTNPR